MRLSSKQLKVIIDDPHVQEGMAPYTHMPTIVRMRLDLMGLRGASFIECMLANGVQLSGSFMLRCMLGIPYVMVKDEEEKKDDEIVEEKEKKKGSDKEDAWGKGDLDMYKLSIPHTQTTSCENSGCLFVKHRCGIPRSIYSRYPRCDTHGCISEVRHHCKWTDDWDFFRSWNSGSPDNKEALVYEYDNKTQPEEKAIELKDDDIHAMSLSRLIFHNGCIRERTGKEIERKEKPSAVLLDFIRVDTWQNKDQTLKNFVETTFDIDICMNLFDGRRLCVKNLDALFRREFTVHRTVKSFIKILNYGRAIDSTEFRVLEMTKLTLKRIEKYKRRGFKCIKSVIETVRDDKEDPKKGVNYRELNTVSEDGMYLDEEGYDTRSAYLVTDTH